MEVQFVRLFGYYLTSHYVPAVLYFLVALTTLCFDATTSDIIITMRVLVNVAALFMASFASSDLSASLPKISYVKAIDVFMGFNFLFIFVILLGN